MTNIKTIYKIFILCILFNIINPIFGKIGNTSYTKIIHNRNISFVCIQNNTYDSCNRHGICINDTYCECNKRYATYPINNMTMCNYKQKDKLTALYLEIFLGLFIGAGKIYIGELFYGLFQFALCVLTIIISTCVILVLDVMLCGKLTILIIIDIVIWILFCIDINSKTATDSNGILLYS
jgi:hypothetical protein